MDLGLKLSTYSDYEREVSQVPSEVVVKAAEYYKVALDHFYSLGRPVNITLNDHSTMGQGYVETNHGADASHMERMQKHIEERSQKLEDQFSRMISAIERLGNGGSDQDRI